MPLLKKKIYNLSRSPEDLKDSEELFVIPETKECFRSYDEYIAKVFLYSSQNWSCQYTGKSSLTYNEALSSEKEALKELESVPDCFKVPILRCIQSAEGNVKDVVERCAKFLTTHYCLKEDVDIMKTNNRKKSSGVIVEILSPSGKRNVDVGFKEKENGAIKYCVQLAESDVILKDVLSNELKRKTKLPSKRLLKMFVKYSAEQLTVEGKDVWIVKDDFVEKYALPAVHKSKEQKKPLRGPLDTISGGNSNSTARQKTKKISPKNVKDPSQRTLNFFIQTAPNANSKGLTTPTKEISKKMKGSPVVAQLQIPLTPKNTIAEVVRKMSGKKSEAISEAEGGSAEGKAVRSLFDVEQDVPKVAEKVNEMGENPIEILDDDEDFVAKKQKGNPNEEEKKCNEHAKIKADKKMNKKYPIRKRAVVVLNDDENEKKIVKKNALKKQKTLSQMLKVDTSKSSIKLQEDRETKTNDVNGSPKKQQKEEKVVVALNEKIEAKGCVEKRSSTTNDAGIILELPPLKTILETARLPLPSPKPASVPEKLREYYGDVLMITEFMFYYGDFLRQDKELRYNPDDLVSGLMSSSSSSRSQVFVHILMGFLQVLLEDLRRQDSSKEFADLRVDLLDMTLSEATVGEMARLYLENYCDTTEHPWTTCIFEDLNRKDIVDFDPVHKLQVLSHLLNQILVSEAFSSHHQKLEENRRLAWIKKVDLEVEIKELLQEQKKLKDEKKPQKDIGEFMEKCSEKNEEMAVDKEPSDCEQAHGDEQEDKVQEKKLTSEGNVGENATSSSLNNRQEMAAKSKVEKEKFDEMRRFGEQIYQRRQKIERCKDVINRVRECRRLESLGSDRHRSQYWLLQSCPDALFVEKIVVSPDDQAAVKENLKDDDMETSSERSWFYYNTKEEISRLISSLGFHDKNENALKVKLLKIKADILSFQNRPTELLKVCSEEVIVGHLKGLKTDIVDLATRITEAHMGQIENLDTWSDDVISRLHLKELVSSVLELGAAVKVQGLWKKLGNREEWLNVDWTQAVVNSKTSSRLRFCVGMLDYCIMWQKSPLNRKCKICRAIHGAGGLMATCEKCHGAFHIFCLRPALEDVPDDEWLCPVCSPGAGNRTRRASTRGNVRETVEEESQEENEDYCDVCGGDGHLICCDTCPKVYHKECHDPPLRNIPRGVWKCCSCQGRRPTARKRSLLIESEEYSDLESSQDDSADESWYSEAESEDAESGDESEVEDDDEAAVERDERAKGRELRRVKEEAKNARHKAKKCSSNKRKRSPSPNDCHIAKRKPRQNSEFRVCGALLTELLRHEDCWPFTDPVDVSEVPDYLEVVSCPMDFGTIKRKLNALEYNSFEECISDIQLVFANSDQYNLSTSDHGLAGISLEAYFKEILPNYFPKYEAQKIQKQSARSTRKRRR